MLRIDVCIGKVMRPILLLSVCLTLAGCGQKTKVEPERFPVRGSVTLDGKPLPQGLIYFKTVATGAIDAAGIKDGTFEGRAEAGDRRVEISAYTIETTQSKDDGPLSHSGRKKNTIPPCYNVESRLTAKVSREGMNEFVFKLLAQ